jgi:NAD-dependent dihydropyrimidine dehydrogenase PreA subunit
VSENRTILYCNCSHAESIDGAARREVLAALAASGRPYVATGDLCGLAARQDAALRRLAAAENVAVAACHPRAVRWLFEYAGAPLPPDARILDMREQPAEQIIEHLLGVRPAAAQPPPPEPPAEGDWVPWFPVIDYDRCVNCKQCLSFCPFGCYGTEEDGRVVVTHPEHCKNHCPACARICPEAAIIFPKSDDPPINGVEAAPGESQRADRRTVEEQIAGRDLHAVLAERRQRLEARRRGGPPCACAAGDEAACDRQRGEEERERCIRESQGGCDCGCNCG